MKEVSHDAVVSVDPEGRITSWNQGAEVLFGYPAKEILGLHFDVLLPADLREQGEVHRLTEETEHRGFLRDYETRRVTKDGREVHVLLTRMRRLDDDGKLLGATAILRDVTARKQMELELVRANTLAAIGEFAARIAHEVRNPLAGMSAAVSLLSSDFPPDHPLAPVVAEIQHQIQRIDTVLDDLLTFARHRPIDRQQIDLVQLLENVVRFLEQAGELKDVTIRRYLPDEASVYADPTMLEDSFFNLLQNAAQAVHGREEASITLAIKTGPRGVAITVTDNGPGVPPAMQTKIFDPFFTTKVHGTGLGLPITRKHVEAHGGWLRLRSAPGKRTTFEIFLPKDSVDASVLQKKVTIP